MRTLLWFVVFLPVLAFAGMGEDEARHLLLRTGWAATPQQVAVTAQLSRAEAVDRLLRENALGNFGTLLHAIARDPAMVLYAAGGLPKCSLPTVRSPKR